MTSRSISKISQTVTEKMKEEPTVSRSVHKFSKVCSLSLSHDDILISDRRHMCWEKRHSWWCWSCCPMAVTMRWYVQLEVCWLADKQSSRIHVVSREERGVWVSKFWIGRGSDRYGGNIYFFMTVLSINPRGFVSILRNMIGQHLGIEQCHV